MTDDLLYQTCPECNGSGVMFYSCCTQEPIDNDIEMCPECGEHLGEEDCNTCEGSGKVLREYEPEDLANHLLQ